jgi:hypothetical protein
MSPEREMTAGGADQPSAVMATLHDDPSGFAGPVVSAGRVLRR